MTTPAQCPFCFPAEDRIAFEDRLTRALWDAFPVSEGHLLLVPRRHVPTWFDATAEEKAALTAGIDRGRELIASRHRPDGFNIGINVGEAAGQTVFHLHVHLIPRYKDDVPDPRGGVRHVIPAKGNYLAAGPAPAPRLVSGGENDPLLPYLGEELTKATTADIAVGFVMPSGLERLGPHLRDFLARNGRLRLLTGDYLGVTEPDALTRLLDLEGDRQLRVFETAHPSGPEHPGKPAPLSFHPKAYIFERADGTGVAFVGSSNLSDSALSTGIEWNYRAVAKADQTAFQEIHTAFDRLFDHPATRELTPSLDRRLPEPPADATKQQGPRPRRRAGRAHHDPHTPRHPAGGAQSPRRDESSRATPPASSSSPPASARPGSAPSTPTAPSSAGSCSSRIAKRS